MISWRGGFTMAICVFAMASGALLSVPAYADSAPQGDATGAVTSTPTPTATALAAPIVSPPVIDFPAPGERLTANLMGAHGHGIPGAIIHVTGASIDSVPVRADGTFTIGFVPPLFMGPHSFTTTQAVSGETSDPVVTSFSVIPPPPTVTSLIDGTTIPYAESPITLSGSAVGGATIRVSVNGVEQSVAVQANQGWALTLDQPLAVGRNTLMITQGISTAISDPFTLTVTVSPPPAVPPAGPKAANPPVAGDALADTGMDSGIPFSLACALIAVGSLALVGKRRRTSKLNAD